MKLNVVLQDFCDFFMGFLIGFHLNRRRGKFKYKSEADFMIPIPSPATQSRHIFTSSRDALGRGMKAKKC